MEDKNLKKRTARKERNRKLKAARQKQSVQNRRYKKTYHDVNSFTKSFTMDILGMVEYKEQLRSIVNERIRTIRQLREKNPRYSSLSTDEFDSCLAMFTDLDTKVGALSEVAASIEATSNLVEKIKITNEHIKELADLQLSAAELLTKLSKASDNFSKKLKTIENPNEVTAEISTENETVEFDEDRGSGDYEADVPADAIPEPVVEQPKVEATETPVPVKPEPEPEVVDVPIENAEIIN